MKKLLLFVAALTFATAMNAQFMLGLQGGYTMQKNTTSLIDDYTSTSSWLGGLQLGYMVTPKLYIGVQGGVLGDNTMKFIASDVATLKNADGDPHDYTVSDHELGTSRIGWQVSPVVRYELFRYGNMHFNVMLSGSIISMGYTEHTEGFIVSDTTYMNPGEYIENDPYKDSVSNFTWSVNVRPTLEYEFSTHLSVELSLDFLSVGYISATTNFDRGDGYTTTQNTLYAGANTFIDALKWESPKLRLGLNYRF